MSGVRRQQVTNPSSFVTRSRSSRSTRRGPSITARSERWGPRCGIHTCAQISVGTDRAFVGLDATIRRSRKPLKFLGRNERHTLQRAFFCPPRRAQRTDSERKCACAKMAHRLSSVRPYSCEGERNEDADLSPRTNVLPIRLPYNLIGRH